MPTHRALAVLAFLTVVPGTALAQQPPTEHPLVTTAPREARQFDFLIGQWELVAEPNVSTLVALIHGTPQLPGTWKAWRSMVGFGIEDELRLSDRSGNPAAMTHSLRAYDSTGHHWNQATVDVYRGRVQDGTAEWKDGAMTVLAHGLDADGHPFVSRSRFYDIGPAKFRWQQDVSYDQGHTWTEGKLKIEAKRVAAIAR